ncbi:hypothetical protein BZK32_15100 [Escherichia coli]|nr:hypothetical protein BZK32_15100 [Escherichia coli]
MGEISVKTGNNARNGGKNSLNRLIRCVCGKKIGPDPRNFNQRVSLGRNDLLIRTFPYAIWSGVGIVLISLLSWGLFGQRLDLPAIIGMMLICAGVLVINLLSRSTPH